MEKSIFGFALAAASVASPSRKPTVVIELQPCLTSALMLSAYSESEFDSTWAVWTPRSALASVRPLSEVWLNDLSSKPPESDTSHALKSGWLSAGAELLVDSVGCELLSVLSDGRLPQPARTSAAIPTIVAVRAVFFTAPPENCVGSRVRQPIATHAGSH